MWKKQLFCLMAIAFLLACTTPPRPLPHHEGKYLDSPKDQVASFDEQLAYAREMGAESLAPKSYEKALKAFEEAKEELREDDDLEEFREEMHQARVYLEEVMEIVKKQPSK